MIQYKEISFPMIRDNKERVTAIEKEINAIVKFGGTIVSINTYTTSWEVVYGITFTLKENE